VYVVFVAQDSHGQKTNGALVADPEQDCTLVGGRQNESHTVVRFRRALDTCDRNHDYVLGVSLVKLLRNSSKHILCVLCTKEHVTNTQMRRHARLHVCILALTFHIRIFLIDDHERKGS
jgi:hypothetical protein